MRRFRSEVAVGMVIFFAMVIFLFGYLYFKNVPLKAGRFYVTVRFDDVTGLEKSDFVSVSGLRIGRVTDMNLDGLQVLVRLQINPGVHLPKDSRALIKSIGMVGEKYIAIVPGTSADLLTDGDVITGINTGDLADMSESVDALMQKTDELITQLNSILATTFDNETRHDLKRSFRHIRNISAALDRTSRQNNVHLNNILANLDTISTHLTELVGQKKTRMADTVENFYQASDRLEQIVDKLDSSLTSLQSLLAKIENEEGALGKVINNDELYREIRGLTARLDALVQDFQKRPHKYLSLGFIKFF